MCFESDSSDGVTFARSLKCGFVFCRDRCVFESNRAGVSKRVVIVNTVMWGVFFFFVFFCVHMSGEMGKQGKGNGGRVIR